MQIILLILISIPAIWSFIPQGYFYTHDGAFHLIRLAHFYNELTNVQFPVRWSNDLAFGFGYPLFNYICPLPYYLGSLFHALGFSLGESLKLVVLLTTLGSTVTVYYWLRCHFNNLASLVGAIFYIYTPFRFVTNYVTGQLGMSVIFFIVPVVLFCINRLFVTQRLFYAPLLSISLAAFLITHNISILIFLPLFIVYSVYMFWLVKFDKQSIKKLFLSVILGFGLASFFIIPAFLEKDFVKIGTGQTVNYKDHFLTINQLIYSKWGYGYSAIGENDGMSFQVGAGQWLVIILVITLIFYRKLFKIKLEQLSFVLLFLTIFLCSIFLMLEGSNFIWSNFKTIQNIQHPWRLLSIIPLSSAVLVSWLISQKLKFYLIAVLMLLVFYSNRNYLRTFEVTRYLDSHYTDNPLVYSGPPDIAWEYLPIWVLLPSTWFSSERLKIEKEFKIDNMLNKDRMLTFTANSSIDTEVTLNTFYFPNQEVIINGIKKEITPTSKTGLISFNLPQGQNNVTLRTISTSLERFSNWLSLISLLFWLLLTYIAVFKRRNW